MTNSDRNGTILVALDASPRSRGVFSAAVELAQRFGGDLVLFRAVGIPIDLPTEALSLSPSDLPQILETAARKDLERWATEVPPGIRATVLVELGTPWQAICAAARAQDVRFIVLGSHGYGGLDRVIGTTASRVVNHADRSVLVVRERPTGAASRG